MHSYLQKKIDPSQTWAFHLCDLSRGAGTMVVNNHWSSRCKEACLGVGAWGWMGKKGKVSVKQRED